MGPAHGCRAVADELFLGRIPLVFSPRSQRDDDEVADARGTVTGFDGCNRILPRTNAFEEVSHVIIADFKAHGVVGQGSFNDVVFTGVEVSAIHPDPTVGAFELQSIALPVLLDYPAIGRVVRRGFHDLFHAIGPGERGFKFTRCGEPAGNWLR